MPKSYLLSFKFMARVETSYESHGFYELFTVLDYAWDNEKCVKFIEAFKLHIYETDRQQSNYYYELWKHYLVCATVHKFRFYLFHT
jgi:hypothetical protein